MARLYVYALLTALFFGCFSAEGAEKPETIDEVMEIVRALQTKITTLETKERKAQDELVKYKDRIANLEAGQEQTKVWMNNRQMDANTMFLATINAETVPVDSGDAIIWNYAPINPGGHFNTVLGSYTAPVNGYYQFSVTKRGDNYEGSFYFLVDEVRYAFKEGYVGGSYSDPATSATINVELTAGQVVRVENHWSTAVHGTSSDVMFSWFTGGLLYAL